MAIGRRRINLIILNVNLKCINHNKNKLNK